MKTFWVVSQFLEFLKSGFSVAVVGCCAARIACIFPDQNKPKRSCSPSRSRSRSVLSASKSIFPSATTSGNRSLIFFGGFCIEVGARRWDFANIHTHNMPQYTVALHNTT